jgi:urease accessory protein
MESDSRLVRGDRPFVFTNCLTGEGITDLLSLLRRDVLFDLPLSRVPA